MKTVKLLAFALLVTSVSFAQTKANTAKTAKATAVAPSRSKTMKQAIPIFIAILMCLNRIRKCKQK